MSKGLIKRDLMYQANRAPFPSAQQEIINLVESKMLKRGCNSQRYFEMLINIYFFFLINIITKINNNDQFWILQWLPSIWPCRN